MKIMQGELQETMFSWPSTGEKSSPEDSVAKTCEDDDPELHPMMENEKRMYKKDEVAYINDCMGLHRVENASHTDKAVSLHLYSPPFGQCHIFDHRTGHQSVAKVTFWSKYGERVGTTAESNQCSQVVPPVTKGKLKKAAK